MVQSIAGVARAIREMDKLNKDTSNCGLLSFAAGRVVIREPMLFQSYRSVTRDLESI